MEEEFSVDERNLKGNGKEAKKRLNKREDRERAHKAMLRAIQSENAKAKPEPEEIPWKKDEEASKKKEEKKRLFEQDLEECLPKNKGKMKNKV